jgi:hypothetical protein
MFGERFGTEILTPFMTIWYTLWPLALIYSFCLHSLWPFAIFLPILVHIVSRTRTGICSVVERSLKIVKMHNK